MTDNLKPCPFCGQKQKDKKWSRVMSPLCVASFRDTYNGDDDEVFYVHCYKCDTTGPEADTEREAIKAWNTRADKE